MKEIRLFLILTLVFVNCGQKPEENEVPLFNNLAFQVLKNEKLAVLDSGFKMDYLKHIADSKLQIPLFKGLDGTNYKMFLGIPFNLSIPRLKEGMNNFEGRDSLEYQTDSATYIFAKYKQDSTYLLEYAQNFDGNVVYVYGSTQNHRVRDSVFILSAINNRFINHAKE